MDRHKYNFSDGLAVALACIGGVIAIALFLVDKTPQTVLILLTLMGALTIYPIIHFVKKARARYVAFLLSSAGILLFGYVVWPEEKPSVRVTPESFFLSGDGRSYKTDLVVTNETSRPLFEVVVEMSSESPGGDFSYEVDKNPDAMIIGPLNTDAIALYGKDPKTGSNSDIIQFYEVLPNKPRHIFITGKKATERNSGHAQVKHFAYEPQQTFAK